MRTPLLKTALFLTLTLQPLVLLAADLELPDPLVSNSGQAVASADQWLSIRRPEILELFRKYIYGRAPVGKPADLHFELFDSDKEAMGGAATRKQVRIKFSGPGGEGAIRLVLFIPNSAVAPAPCFLLICNRPRNNIDPTRAEKSPFWPAEQIVARGYAAAAFFNGDVAPDDKNDGYQTGVFKAFDQGSRQPDAWGTIAAWAWGASRALDYLETRRDIDAKRVAVVGHSRGGKTALWAGAEDPRFAMVVSNDSGCTGAAISRGKEGEHIADINRAFPHWFDGNYKAYNGRENELPVDQHMLAALIAPRLLYLASAAEDHWADPSHEFLSAVNAEPVFHLFGLPGLSSHTMPAPDAPMIDGQIGYHVRSGGHDLTPYDWNCFMDFADRHLRSRSEGAAKP